MIKKLNFVCLFALALSGMPVRAQEASATVVSANGWSNQITVAAKVVGVVGIVGLIIAAFATLRSKKAGNRLGHAQPVAVDVAAFNSLVEDFKKLRAEHATLQKGLQEARADHASLDKWTTKKLTNEKATSAAEFTMLREDFGTIKATTDRLQAEVDSRPSAADLSRVEKAIDTKIRASLAPVTEELDAVKHNVEIQATTFMAVSQAQKRFDEEARQLTQLIEKQQADLEHVKNDLAQTNGQLPDLIRKNVIREMANRSLERDRGQGVLSPTASKTHFGEDVVHPISPRAEGSASASAPAPLALVETT